MLGWVGWGVAIPLPALVVVLATGVVLTVEEVTITGGAEDFNEVGVDEGACVVGPGAGAGSSIASTQYDFPGTRPPQEAVIEGFCSLLASL
jgi:hypothetical protein